MAFYITTLIERKVFSILFCEIIRKPEYRIEKSGLPYFQLEINQERIEFAVLQRTPSTLADRPLSVRVRFAFPYIIKFDIFLRRKYQRESMRLISSCQRLFNDVVSVYNCASKSVKWMMTAMIVTEAANLIRR